MKKFLVFTLFNHAGPTGRVFRVSGSSVEDKGAGWSGWVSPSAVMSVVPTDLQTVNVSIDCFTKDNQKTTISGYALVSFIPDEAVKKMDFRVDETGSYVTSWEDLLASLINEKLVHPLLSFAKNKNLEELYVDLQGAADAFNNSEGKTVSVGGFFDISSFSVREIRVADNAIANAIGASEREAIKQKSLDAVHKTQMEALKNEKTVKKQKETDAQEIAEEVKKTVVIENTNKLLVAQGVTAANAVIFEKMKEISPQIIVATAFFEIAKSGKDIGTLNLNPDFFTQIFSQTGKQ